jgi:opacity protein-like surface antigen
MRKLILATLVASALAAPAAFAQDATPPAADPAADTTEPATDPEATGSENSANGLGEHASDTGVAASTKGQATAAAASGSDPEDPEDDEDDEEEEEEAADGEAAPETDDTRK